MFYYAQVTCDVCWVYQAIPKPALCLLRLATSDRYLCGCTPTRVVCPATVGDLMSYIPSSFSTAAHRMDSSLTFIVFTMLLPFALDPPRPPLSHSAMRTVCFCPLRPPLSYSAAQTGSLRPWPLLLAIYQRLPPIPIQPHPPLTSTPQTSISVSTPKPPT